MQNAKKINNSKILHTLGRFFRFRTPKDTNITLLNGKLLTKLNSTLHFFSKFRLDCKTSLLFRILRVTDNFLLT